jgi:hypothetical protein
MTRQAAFSIEFTGPDEFPSNAISLKMPAPESPWIDIQISFFCYHLNSARTSSSNQLKMDQQKHHIFPIIQKYVFGLHFLN